MSRNGRIAMLGGTFDPPHVGHLVVAQDVLERLSLDRLIVVPAGDPPHRGATLPARDRLELVRLAFGGDDRIEVSDVEVGRSGPSYTVDTLEWLRQRFEPAALYLVIGADQLRTFGTWHRPGRILELATLAVMTRPGEEDLLERADVPFERVQVTRVDLSSTRVRARLGEGQSIRYLVPERIREMVEAAWGRSGDLHTAPNVESAEEPDRGRREPQSPVSAGRGETEREC